MMQQWKDMSDEVAKGENTVTPVKRAANQ